MGLLDFLNTGDPEKDAAISRGLLSAGLALMQSRGKFLPSLSQGGFAGLQSYDADRQRQYQQKLQKASLDAIARKKMLDEREDTLANLPGQYIKPASQGNNPSAYTPGSADIQGLIERYMATPGGLQTGLALSNAFAKPKPTISKPGDVARDEAGNVVWQNPAAPDQGTPLAQLIAEQSKYQPGSPQWKTYEAAIQKASKHPDPITLNNYGPPLPIELPGGGTGYIQPPTRPGGPSAMVTVPGTGKPAVKPNEAAAKDPTEFQSKAGLYFKSMTTATQTLDEIESSNGWRPSMLEASLDKHPTAQGIAMTLPRQKYVQAQRQWIDSINRVRSGANLPELEYERAVRTFFPVYGEGEEVRRQKAEARKQEEVAMKEAAGRALKQPSGGDVLRFNERGEPVK